MKISQLDHVALHVADVDASCAFYSQVLKLESMSRPAFDFPGAWFQLGSTQELHLIGEREERVVSHNRGNHFALMVDDLDAWEDHVRSQNAEIVKRHFRPDGAGQMFIKDPDGHVVELCTPVPK